jgi:hypothetical protein
LTRLEIQRRRKAARPIPPAVTLLALLDTGADCTCVERNAVSTLTLPLKNMGFGNVPMLGGLIPIFQVDADLTIMHPSNNSQFNLVIGNLPLTEMHLGAVGYDLLIGRDVLKFCRFVFDGLGDRFHLTY